MEIGREANPYAGFAAMALWIGIVVPHEPLLMCWTYLLEHRFRNLATAFAKISIHKSAWSGFLS
jgi:hypothetical protein